ncbi:MAG: diguanylate cyclase [Clostridiales bacterium]|nr:diguanylate cyclase [Clostridiales bacterium]
MCKKKYPQWIHIKKTVSLLLVFAISIVLLGAGFDDTDDEFDEFELFMNHGSIMLIINPENGQIFFANHAAADFYKYSIEELKSLNITEINMQSPDEVQLEMALAKVELRNYFEFEHKIKDGTIKYVEVYSYPIFYEGTNLLFSIIFDVTESKQMEERAHLQEEQSKIILRNTIFALMISLIVVIIMLLSITFVNRKLKYLTKYDHLTGILNRISIYDVYNRFVHKDKLPVTLFMADANNLKFVNDTFGHLAGDEMIIKVANLLESIARKRGKAARVSGDEFVLLMPNCNHKEAKMIENSLRETRVKVKELTFSISVGHLVVTNSEINFDHAFSIAESEMYTNKSMNRKSRNMEIENDLLKLLYGKQNRESNNMVHDVATLISESLELSNEEIISIREASKLQDIGLAVVEGDFLKTNELLNESEIDTMKKHPEKSYEILNSLGKAFSVANTIFHHHEHYDGTGYPKGLSGEEIPLSSRILAISNAINELVVNHRSVTIEHIKEELLKHSGTMYDPKIIDMLNKKDFIIKLNELINKENT